MKNLISSFSILNLKKNKQKDLKLSKSLYKVDSVHRRRDLDSLEEFIQFK